ncbi:hypothetical protein ABEB36_005676 [Hypothenemus hampei]|uniref:Odorant receptor n=1 Tax=Hypothenemus hampei TaxID=57062 RepID=A0ABD1F0A3_HYPHA
MKHVKTTMLLLGIWPVRRNGDFLEILYEIYFLTTFIYYIIFNISGLALAIQTWSANYLTTASSMGIVIEYVSNAYKVILIEEKEQRIFQSNNEAFIKIYKQNSASNRNVVLFYTLMGTIGISLYFITPIISNVTMPLGFNNQTGIKNHYFIVFSWFPFDPNRYYTTAYLIQFFGCLIGYSYIVHCGAFYISILSFIRAQLKILQQTVSHLPEYCITYKRQFNLNEQHSQIVVLRALIQEHLDIIDFVTKLNDTIRSFSLMNFIISSFQLSLVAYQIFQLPVLQQITVFSYFITLSTQLFLTYNAAHQIIIESENIASSIFEGDWYDYSPETSKFLQMICMRAQKPLAMTIGPISDMKITALFQIFKALYSYICLIMKA